MENKPAPHGILGAVTYDKPTKSFIIKGGIKGLKGTPILLPTSGGRPLIPRVPLKPIAPKNSIILPKPGTPLNSAILPTSKPSSLASLIPLINFTSTTNNPPVPSSDDNISVEPVTAQTPRIPPNPVAPPTPPVSIVSKPKKKTNSNKKNPEDEWTEVHTLELIACYRGQPCMYNPKDANYTNKVYRLQVMQAMRLHLAMFRPNVTGKYINSSACFSGCVN